VVYMENEKMTTISRSKLKFDNPFLRSVHNDVYKRKRNALIAICGSVGTGKSYIALRIAEQLDTSFTAETLKDRLILSPEQFMKIITRDKNKLKTGSVIIIDEASTQMYNRQWSSMNNQMINYILTTFRHRRLVCIMTTPYLDFLDSNVRRLFDYFVEATKVNFKLNQSAAKVYKLSYNKMKADKSFKKYFRQKRDSEGRRIGSRVRLKILWFDKPADDLCELYEDYAGEFKQKIAEEALHKALAVQEKEEKKNIDIKEIIKKVLENKKRYFKMRGNRSFVDRALVEADFEVGGAIGLRIKKLAEFEAKEQKLINV